MMQILERGKKTQVVRHETKSFTISITFLSLSRHVSSSVFLFLSRSLSPDMSLSLSFFFSLSLSISKFHCFCVPLPLSTPSISLSPSLSFPLFICLTHFPSASFLLTLSVSLHVCFFFSSTPLFSRSNLKQSLLSGSETSISSSYLDSS